jgi:tetraacyldisaccharide 4'-kinase
MNMIDLINPYAYAMILRRMFYHKRIFRSGKVSLPVISIGNISMGGTGKTPVTLKIAGYCLETLHKKTAIILRGYKRKSSGYLLVSDGINILENINKSGDEAQLYARQVPDAIVICDEDRLHGARKAEALGAEIILLDDGFQHLSINRDLNILLINSEEGTPPVLPFGKGREPFSAMSDADIIIQTNFREDKQTPFHSGEKNVLQAATTLSSVNLYSADEEIDALPEILGGEHILTVSGIAHPENFERLLSTVTTSIVSYRLSDHAEYDKATLYKISAKIKNEKCTMVATTTKDAVKLLKPYREMQRSDPSLPPLAVIQTEITFIHGEEILFHKINDLFS